MKNIYTDQELFEKEFEMYYSNWLWSSKVIRDIPEGKYVLATLPFNIEIILTKVAGDIKAYLNVCSHKNTKLIKHPINDKLICQYHKWEYDCEGKCINTPDLELNHKNIKLRNLKVDIWNEYIFVNFQDTPSEFKEWVSQYIHGLKNNELYLLDTLTFPSEVNWKLVMDNELDNYHVKTNHIYLNEISSDDNSEEEFYGKYQESYYLKPPNQSATLTGKRIDNKPDLLKPKLTYSVIFPNFSFLFLDDYTLVTEIFPIAPEKTKMRNYIYSHTPGVPEATIKDLVTFWETTGNEDKELCLFQQIGNSNPFSNKHKIYSSVDKILKNYFMEYNSKINNKEI